MESHACRSPSLGLRHGLGKWHSFYMTARMSPRGEKNLPIQKTGPKRGEGRQTAFF